MVDNWKIKKGALPPADFLNFTLCEILSVQTSASTLTSFFSCAPQWMFSAELCSPTMVVETFGVDSVKSTLTTGFDSLWLQDVKGLASGIGRCISS